MRLLRPAAALTVLGLAGAGVVVLASPAGAATTPDTTKLAAYLTGQLVDGDHYEPFGPGFTDVGLTIDGALALAATGKDTATVGAIADHLDSETGRNYGEFDGDPANLTAGAVAKLALLAEVAHRDPHDYAQLDLIQLLDDNVCDAARVTSNPDQCAAPGNYYGATSVFSQTLGVIAQQRAGTATPSAVTYLLSLQRPDGAFPSLIPNSNDSDPDSTAMAVQALAVLPDASNPGSPANTALADAVSYLAGSQNADGSWGPSYNPKSVNSTGLVIQAFSIDGATRATHAASVTKGLAFLAGLQNTDGGLPVGDVAGQTDSDVRASTQGLGGVLGVPFGTLSTPVAVARTATTLPAAKAAASWLVGQLVTGDHVEGQFGGQSYVQQGTTADVGFGLLASGGQDVTLGRVLSYLTLDTTLRSYVNGSNFGDDADSAYVGATAKLATLLELAGQDPTDVGVNHVDLIASLKSLQATDGRFHDRSAFGDFANVYGQAFGVLALTGAGDTAAAAKARTALIGAQCTDGGFPEKFGQATCTSIPDATGLAVQALNAGHATRTKTVTAAAAPTELVDALGWLTTNQAADGSYAGAPGVTNSTGYAALGLLAVGQNATKPRAFLAGIANSDGGLPVTATGASDPLATAQALPALAGASFLQLTPSVLAPVDTIVGDDPPPTTTPPTSTPPTTTSPTVSPSGGTGSPTGGQSGQGGTATDVSGGDLADTGANVLTPLWPAVLALAIGAAATAYGVHRPRRGSHAARRH